MRTVVVTGAQGFIGRNLVTALKRREGVRVLEVEVADSADEIRDKLRQAAFVYHLAGANRPAHVAEFMDVNAGLTAEVVREVAGRSEGIPVVLASSTQATQDNPYGRSKLAAEEILERYATDHGGSAIIFRLPNVFGKWCRPNYNSVVATFCHNVAHGVPLEIHDPAARLRLVHVDDVVRCFLDMLAAPPGPGAHRPEVTPVHEATVGELGELVSSFGRSRDTLEIPDLGDGLRRLLLSTFLTYLPKEELSYPLTERSDQRGRLAEVVKSAHAGQLFVSTTAPGVTRGNHYHDSKFEKFCVVAGRGVVRLRPVDSADVVSYEVSGERFSVVDIPPGYAHSIENVGESEMVVLFWASEIFDPARPDTHSARVLE